MKSGAHKEICSIGLNITYYRKLQGLTQSQLAEKTSYSRNHIQQIETGNTVPSIVALLDIAEALHIPLTKLFDFK